VNNDDRDQDMYQDKNKALEISEQRLELRQVLHLKQKREDYTGRGHTSGAVSAGKKEDKTHRETKRQISQRVISYTLD